MSHRIPEFFASLALLGSIPLSGASADTPGETQDDDEKAQALAVLPPVPMDVERLEEQESSFEAGSRALSLEVVGPIPCENGTWVQVRVVVANRSDRDIWLPPLDSGALSLQVKMEGRDASDGVIACTLMDPMVFEDGRVGYFSTHDVQAAQRAAILRPGETASTVIKDLTFGCSRAEELVVAYGGRWLPSGTLRIHCLHCGK